MSKVRLSLGLVDYYDRTRPVIDGKVETPDIDLTCVPLPPKVLGTRYAEFDVAEVAVTAYFALRSAGDKRFVGLPVFPYRGFTFGNTVVNSASKIERPEDLVGKRVGTGLQLAGTMWARGFLSDNYGVGNSQLIFFVANRPTVNLPVDTKVEVIPAGRTLSDMLDQGEIDAWMGSSLPECFERGSPRVRRLFQDYRTVEENYARRTRFFPILHMIVLRREIYEQHRWVATDLFEIFQRAKQIGAGWLRNEGNFACALPWLRHDLEELPKIFNGDWYPYGFEANREILSTMVRYAAEQGITREPLDIEELFVPEARS
jgi:4,5-dihydroxyphthalate decarboxylase